MLKCYGNLLLASVLMASAWAHPVRAEQLRSYLGVFGGLGSLAETDMQQKGTVITPAPFPDIDVNARGTAPATFSGLAGVQLGHEFWQSAPQSGWRAGLSGEIEGLYFSARPEGVLDIDPQALGTQYVTLPLANAAVLVNAVMNLETPYSGNVTPYIGVGAGYGMAFVTGSDSTNPSEPGINHFNSQPDASAGGLALQAKFGLRARVADHWSVFTEYRHVYLAPVGLTFGETDYPGGHLPTTRWNVDLGAQNVNLWVTGLSYGF